MADSGNQVGLGIVQQSKASDIVKDNRSAYGFIDRVTHQMNAGQKRFFSSAHAQGENFVKAVRNVVPIVAENASGVVGEFCRQGGVKRKMSTQFLGSAVLQFNASCGIEDEYGIRKRSESRFHCVV